MKRSFPILLYQPNRQIWNVFLNGDSNKIPTLYLCSSHTVEFGGRRFSNFNTVELSWALLQLSSVPFDDNGGERMGTLLRLGIAVKSIWRRPPPFYPARTSSALESCGFLARLPSSPQVVSESHPPAICRWLGLPPEILGKKNPEKQTPSSPRWEAAWRLSFLCIKEQWPWFEGASTNINCTQERNNSELQRAS